MRGCGYRRSRCPAGRGAAWGNPSCCVRAALPPFPPTDSCKFLLLVDTDAGEQGGPSALSSRRLGSAQLKQLWSLRLRSRGRQGRGSVWAGGRTADPREPQPQRQSCRARESGNEGRGTRHDACPAHGERAPCLWPAPQAGPREVGGALGRRACTPQNAFTHTQEPSRAFPHIVYGSPAFCYLSASQPW